MRDRRTLIAAVAAAGILLGATSFPLLAFRPAEEPKPQQQPPPPQPPPPRPGIPTSQDGARFFFDRDAAPAKIACADCHALTLPGEPPPDDRIRAGHSIYDAFGRGTWWNGRITTDCGEAAEVCFKRYMGGEEFDGHTRTALVLYMKGLSEPAANPLIIHRMPPGKTDVNQGDATRGQDLFRRACALCHPTGGSALGPDLRASKMTPREIADTIRTGKGRMPLFQIDILPDGQTADIAAYGYSLQPRSN